MNSMLLSLTLAVVLCLTASNAFFANDGKYLDPLVRSCGDKVTKDVLECYTEAKKKTKDPCCIERLTLECQMPIVVEKCNKSENVAMDFYIIELAPEIANDTCYDYLVGPSKCDH